MLRRVGLLVTAAALSSMLSSPAFAAGPINISPPMIYGITIVGQSISVTQGSWDVAPLSYSYQWFRCVDTLQTNCEAIPNASGQTYLLGTESSGKFLKVSVTAITAGGGSTVQSALSIVVSQLSKALESQVVSGELLKVSLLTSTKGVWNVSNANFTYQWNRCTLLTGGDCAAIAGATSSSYSPTTEDVSSFVSSTVSANPLVAGFVSGTAASTPVGPILSQPIQVGATTLSGAAVEGETLTVNVGRIFASPKANVTYVWQKCAGSSITTCTAIPGETSNSLTVLPAYNSTYLRVVPTIQNELGGIIVPSSSIGPVVKPTSPINSDAPSIVGDPLIGSVVQGINGTWSATPLADYVTGWLKCSSNSVSSCVDVPSNISNSLTLGLADAGKRIAFKVTGKNRIGSTTAISALSAPIDYKAKLTSPPLVLGFGLVGMKLTTVAPSWSETYEIPMQYQWQRCVKSDPNTCSDIKGATASSYTLVQDDQDSFIRVGVVIPGKTLLAFSALGKDAVYAGADSPAAVKPAPAPAVTKPVTTPKPVAKPVVKATTITCVKGSLSKKVTAISPKCPTGYKKK